LKMRKIPKEERSALVRRAAEILGIQDLLERKPRQLSGGQKQRVALGRAIVRDPDVFLFDEPLSNLDAKLRVQMRTELKKLHDRLQATVVYVTHDQVEAMTMGDRIVVMKDGNVQQIGTPLDLYNKPANLFVAGFIGSPAMNFIPCRVLEEDSRIYIDAKDFRIPLPNSMASKVRPIKETDFIFGIRPEDFREKREERRPSSQRATIRAKVNVIEPLGKELYLDLNTGVHTLTALLSADTETKLHQDIDLVPHIERIHLFKKRSGEAIF
jgi:multiple sugar transport system ATP-binding protein